MSYDKSLNTPVKLAPVNSNVISTLKIRLINILVALLISGGLHAAEDPQYIVVKGATSDCPDWRWRILEIVEVYNTEVTDLLGMPSVRIRPLEPQQILNNLIESIEQLHGYTPTSLSVEILNSEIEYKAIIREYIHSLQSLVNGKCPFPQSNMREKMEEDLEQTRKLELSRRLSMGSDITNHLSTFATLTGPRFAQPLN